MFPRQVMEQHKKEAKNARLASARLRRWPGDAAHTIQNARQYAFAIIVHGGRFTQLGQILAFCNITTPTSWMFYRAQGEICQEIFTFAVESCRLCREQMEPGTVIVMDGSWSQRRNALHCLVDFTDVIRGKIVDFEILQRGQGFLFGDYFGPSNGMEVEGVRRIIQRWENSFQEANEKVVSYVHDRDAKTRKLIRELWNKPELLDPNHVTKGFDRKLGSEPSLRGLKSKLRRWFVFLLKLEQTCEEKQRLWCNSSQHYQGVHDGCPPHPYIPNPPLRVPTHRSVGLVSDGTGNLSDNEIFDVPVRKPGRPHAASQAHRMSAPQTVSGPSKPPDRQIRAANVTGPSSQKVATIRHKIQHLEQFLDEIQDLLGLCLTFQFF
jgi:hypothetical protein